jgi:uncharacterized protein YbaP (TraB family)
MKISRRIMRSTHIVKYSFTPILLFTLVVLLLSSFIMTGGCDFITGADKSTPLTGEENGKSFMWKISSDDSYVYLLGSIHIGKPDFYPLDSTIENVFERSDKLVVENNVNEVSALKSMLLLEKYGTYPEGEGLRENLPRQLFVKLTNQLWSAGIGISTLNNYRPWVILTLMDGIIAGEYGYTVEYGIDLYFLEKAAKRGIEILELETAESQMKMLSDISEEVMILVLEQYVEEPLTLGIISLMFKAWEDGDAEGMAELVYRDLDNEPALAPYYGVLFTERNYNMLTKIEEFLADKYTYFIVVGAGHLVGEEGLVNLLNEAGYTVEQL